MKQREHHSSAGFSRAPHSRHRRESPVDGGLDDEGEPVTAHLSAAGRRS
ncbi:hypothetical protein [Kineosporia sp. NBRC 101677]|nr:hypothetical protein [Kineosporia sp. NBRC 101677]